MAGIPVVLEFSFIAISYPVIDFSLSGTTWIILKALRDLEVQNYDWSSMSSSMKSWSQAGPADTVIMHIIYKMWNMDRRRILKKDEGLAEKKQQTSVVFGSFYEISNSLIQWKTFWISLFDIVICVRAELVFCSIFLSV